jgi:hypothetical protein
MQEVVITVLQLIIGPRGAQPTRRAGWEEGASRMPRRVYVLESVLSFGEDSRHEFKGHRCLSVEELPKSSFIPGTLRRSKKAISRFVVHVV